jgi:hypothetical protein
MSLFRGRQNVFAIRWERDDRSGYMPAYDLNLLLWKFFISCMNNIPEIQ